MMEREREGEGERKGDGREVGRRGAWEEGGGKDARATRCRCTGVVVLRGKAGLVW